MLGENDEPYEDPWEEPILPNRRRKKRPPNFLTPTRIDEKDMRALFNHELWLQDGAGHKGDLESDPVISEDELICDPGALAVPEEQKIAEQIQQIGQD